MLSVLAMQVMSALPHSNATFASAALRWCDCQHSRNIRRMASGCRLQVHSITCSNQGRVLKSAWLTRGLLP